MKCFSPAQLIINSITARSVCIRVCVVVFLPIFIWAGMSQLSESRLPDWAIHEIYEECSPWTPQEYPKTRSLAYSSNIWSKEYSIIIVIIIPRVTLTSRYRRTMQGGSIPSRPSGCTE